MKINQLPYNLGLDPVQMLYADLPETGSFSRNPHKVSTRNWEPKKESAYQKEIKVLIPEGLRNPLSLDTTRNARLCLGSRSNCEVSYKVKIQAMLTKTPGFLFTAYQSAMFFSQELISEP